MCALTIRDLSGVVEFTEWVTEGCTVYPIDEYYELGWHWDDAQDFLRMNLIKIELISPDDIGNKSNC